VPKKAELKAVFIRLRKANAENNLRSAFAPEALVSQKTLKDAFRKLSLRIHPDQNSEERDLAEKIFTTLLTVKDELINSLPA
jgi:hypothetical protein